MPNRLFAIAPALLLALGLSAANAQPMGPSSLGSPTLSDSQFYTAPEGYYDEVGQRATHAPRLRSSLTHGRATGLGQPLGGTSWLNRPFEYSLEAGALVMANDPGGSSKKANDAIAAIQFGWDLDHYWGTQLRFAWSSPDWRSDVPAVGEPKEELTIVDFSLLYYPWGDSKVRPYYRAGFGLTDVDFIDNAGNSIGETLVTVPLAVGLKYQKHRWMAVRLEAADYIAFGQGEANTMNNFTFMLGAEWRFGGKPAPGWRRENTRGLH